MATEGYQYLIYTCPQVQSELLQVLCLDCGGGVAVANMNREGERPGFPIFCTTTHLASLPTPLQPTGHLGAQSVSGYSVSARRPGPSEGRGGRGRRDGPAPPQPGGGRGVVYGGPHAPRSRAARLMGLSRAACRCSLRQRTADKSALQRAILYVACSC